MRQAASSSPTLGRVTLSQGGGGGGGECLQIAKQETNAGHVGTTTLNTLLLARTGLWTIGKPSVTCMLVRDWKTRNFALAECSGYLLPLNKPLHNAVFFPYHSVCWQSQLGGFFLESFRWLLSEIVAGVGIIWGILHVWPLGRMTGQLETGWDIYSPQPSLLLWLGLPQSMEERVTRYLHCMWLSSWQIFQEALVKTAGFPMT